MMERRAADIGAPHRLPPEGWRHAGPRTRSRTIDRGLLVRPDPRCGVYCLEYGPLHAPVAGTYHFTLTYELRSGAIAFGVLDDARTGWLTSTSTEGRAADDGRTTTVSVDVAAGTRFWLVISNDDVARAGIRRFVVRALSRSVEPLISLGTAKRTAFRVWTAARDFVPRLPSRAWQAVSDLVSGRLRSRIVRRSPEFRRLEEEHRATVAELGDLAPLAGIRHVYELLQERRPHHLHANASGDFQLMAREHWIELRGYPEFQGFSMNVDGLLSSIAHYAGIREVALHSPLHIYHLEHNIGSGWTPEGQSALVRRITESGISWLHSEDAFVCAAYMDRLGAPMIFNTAGWGFGADSLAETVILPTRTPGL